MDTQTTATPALDAVQRAKEEGSDVVGEFLDWLPTQDLGICSFDDWGEMQPARLAPEQLLDKFFGIDSAAVERERRALLASLRAAHS